VTTFTLRRDGNVIYAGPSFAAAARALRPDTDSLTFFSVCSGIEAASVAWTPLGWKCVGVAEIEKFPSATLAHHYPGVRNHGDFTKVDTKRLGRVDILCGGTPYQAFSIAGARQSLDDARGNLTLAFVGLAHELAEGNGLRNVVWENVPGVLSTKDNAFGCFLAGLVGADRAFLPASPCPAVGKSNRSWGWSAKERAHYIKWPRSGMVTGPKGRAAWTVKDAQYYGLAQRRERVIVIADFGNGADPAAVLFEPEGVRRNSPPSREAGQGFATDVAPSLVASGRGVERPGDTRGQDPVVATFAIQERAVSNNLANGPQGKGYQPDIAYTLEARNKVQSVSYAPAISRPLLAKGNDSFDDTLQTYIPQLGTPLMAKDGRGVHSDMQNFVAVSVTGAISHALKAEGADASEDGTGRGTPIICFSAKDYGADATNDLAPTLRAGGHSGSHANAGVMPAIAWSIMPMNSGKDYKARVTDISQPLMSVGPMSGNQGGDYIQQPLTVALRGREDGGTAELGGDVAFALRASTGGGDKPHVLTSAVRRLTPRECERLQGFQWQCDPTYPQAWQDHAGRWWSPDYTAIPWRGKPAALCPDGPRYKALGNSWAVPKFRWLGQRIARFMPR
jgi:DNA (cytosine-5)-methyltransferase 1